MAVDARHHRDVEGVAQAEAAEAARPRRAPILQPGLVAALFHIGAGAEGAFAGAGHDDAAHVVVLLDRLPDADQFRLGSFVDGVHAIGPVDGDPRDVVLDDVFDVHATTLAWRSSAMRSGV